MLRIENLVVHYGGVAALDGISLEVEEGSIVTLIGANGAGKSTCLKAVSGLVRPTSGEIWFQGTRIDGMKPQRIVKMGIVQVPEGRRLFPYMSVFDNLLTGAHLRKDQEQIARDLDGVYRYFPILLEKRKQAARSLSGGQQQMVAFGRGLMAHPKVFLFDEPSLGLAPMLVREVGEHIRQHAEEGYTIVLVEQNANLALALADRAYVLERGRIVLEGAAKELRDNEYVRKAYLGI
ncbi:ABC transporter ATP-binding protein [Candidatus Fermentibacteria bacterium]|nr:ABC transporter ATP-binding protein [Candidatus Fermentibacteria bacterium]